MASPTPPSFLCPSLESGDPTACNIAKRAPTQVSRPPHTFDPRHTHAPRNVPDRFSKQADGAWRRVGSYTLYGSTMPACSSSCATPTAVISPLDDQIQVSDATDPATTSTLLDTVPTDLPPGWKPLEKHNRTALILLISLFLALFIGSLIVGSMLWRNRLKRRRARDVEAKKRRRHMDNEADVREILVEKEIKAKQKIWAKATARWRSNARFSARQRRGRRLSARLSLSNQSSASLDNSRTCLAEPPPSAQPGISPRSSTSSLADNHPSEDTPIPPSSSSSREDASAPHEPQARISPPAYHHHGQIPSLMLSPGDASSTELIPSTATGKERLVQDDAHTPTYPALCDRPQSSIPMSMHAAHVATDDKAMLARLAELASAPPEEDSGPIPQTSVPEWNDDDVEDIASHLLTPSPSQFPFSPMFPPPPSKERLAAAEQLYDYSYAFDEAVPLDFEAGPSAPPFEERSSPPPEGLIPSAPPLFDDDQHPDAEPSAPPLDPSLQPESESEPGVTTREHHNHEPSPSDHMHASLVGPGPFTGASPIRDSVVLPGYQP